MDESIAATRPMGKPTANATVSALFFTPEQVVSMDLPAEARFVVFVRGESPQVVPINDPGTYSIDCAILKNGQWPVLVSILPLDTIKYFLKMTPEHVGHTIDKAIGGEE